ncbi:MAG: MBL fold metallo-hydrolase [Treponema sp.]|jgi:glyoxylase-like metal-dependent hydrolase (beta-lactamase superfamily II)|nr:MBL fold metallo-hydrolase [Treponema sp.]
MRREMILGLVLSMATVMGCGTSGKQAQKTYTSSESDGIFHCKVGQFDVFMLVEAQREGNAGILVGADEALLSQYIPAGGFMHSTNAFLIKTPTQNILVDTAFGGIFEKMKKLGVEPDQVDAVLITHLHGDHFSGLQKDGAAALSKAKIYLAAREYAYFTETQVNDGAVAALAPYDGNIVTFEPATLGSTLSAILPGISPIANYGHTPGHTVYLVENGKDKLIIAGDFLHIALLQFPVPNISASYDMDKEEAAVSRRQILDYAATNKIPIGGMHIVYPGLGSVEADGDGYKFVPAK